MKPNVECSYEANRMNFKIVLVEDDLSLVETVKLVFSLTWPEATILDANTGEDGIKLTQKADPDAVLLDLGLPDISGFEVLQRIRVFSRTPVIILTARTDPGSVDKAFKEGANEYVAKPFRSRD